MNVSIRRSIIVLLSVFLITSGGCGSNTTQQQSLTRPNPGIENGNGVSGNSAGSGISMLSTAKGASVIDQAIPFVQYDGISYVSGNDLARGLNFNTNWQASDNLFQMGDNDASYEWKVDALELKKGEDSIQLSEAPILRNSLIYIPVSAMPLLQEDINFDLTDKELVIHPAAEMVTDAMDGPEEPNTGSELDFADDPDDPFKGEDAGIDTAEETAAGISDNESRMVAELLENEQGEDAVPTALRNIDMNALIRKAKAYLGVKYLFGAKPYPRSSKFDCSTFTGYVYGRYGVSLPRTARAQARQGIAVSRKSLRKGDLMFFYVPGRFRTNKTVGHVAIYIGNSRIIHASPKPKNGVQFTNINKPYWKKTFLKARRIAY